MIKLKEILTVLILSILLTAAFEIIFPENNHWSIPLIIATLSSLYAFCQARIDKRNNN